MGKAGVPGFSEVISPPALDFHEVLWDGAACTVLHFDGDRTIERHSQADMLGLMVQVGAIPAPA